MEKTGLTLNKLSDGLLAYQDIKTKRDNHAVQKNVDKSLNLLLITIKEFGKSGSIGDIIACEKALLLDSMNNHINSKGQEDSLKLALNELMGAEKSYQLLTNDPEQYKKNIDVSYSTHKTLIGDLPKDQARQFFLSHSARLNNATRADFDVMPKQIYDARKDNIRTAGKLYANLQEQVCKGVMQKSPATKSKDNSFTL